MPERQTPNFKLNIHARKEREWTETLNINFDILDRIVGKLVPKPPQSLSNLDITLTGAYSAKQAGLGNLRTTVIDNTMPSAEALNFFDGDAGTLEAFVDSVSVGSKILSEASDVGTSSRLIITADTDPYLGQAGKEGFYKQLSARFSPASALSLGGSGHTFQLKHSITGNSKILNVWVDSPAIPAIENASSQPIIGPTPKYVSGIPVLGSGDKVSISYTVKNAVSDFYHPTRIARVESTVSDAVDMPSPGIAPAVNADISVNLDMFIKNSVFSSAAVFKLIGYNSKGVSGFLNYQTTVRVDSVSNESQRVKSGSNQFPIKGASASQFGSPFNNQELLTTNEELQMENGVYKYPPAIDYTSIGGPDYSTIQGGSYQDYRWVTLNLGSVSNVNGITLTFQNPQGFSAAQFTTTETKNLKVYAKVDGASGTGWLDANKAYPGVGNPVDDGSQAMVVSNSNLSIKRVTFGTAVRTGIVYVRVGIPKGSTMSFTGIARS